MLPQQNNLDACLRILYTNTKFKNYILNHINRKRHNSFRYYLRLVFLNNFSSSWKNKADILSSATGVKKEVCYPIISTLESLINHSQRLEDWKNHRVKSFKTLPCFDFRTCDACGEKGNSMIKIQEAQIGVNLPPFHVGCRCVARAFFEHTELTGTKMANDPISDERFEMDTNATYGDWIKSLEEKYGKEAIRFQRELVKNKIYSYSTQTFINFYNHYNKDKLPYSSLSSRQLEVLAKESFSGDREKSVELLKMSAEKESYYPYKAKSYRTIGEYYLGIHDKEKALYFFELALNYNPKVGVKRIFNNLKKESLITLDDINN